MSYQVDYNQLLNSDNFHKNHWSSVDWRNHTEKNKQYFEVIKETINQIGFSDNLVKNIIMHPSKCFYHDAITHSFGNKSSLTVSYGSILDSLKAKGYKLDNTKFLEYLRISQKPTIELAKICGNIDWSKFTFTNIGSYNSEIVDLLYSKGVRPTDDELDKLWERGLLSQYQVDTIEKMKIYLKHFKKYPKSKIEPDIICLQNACSLPGNLTTVRKIAKTVTPDEQCLLNAMHPKNAPTIEFLMGFDINIEPKHLVQYSKNTYDPVLEKMLKKVFPAEYL